MQRKQARVGIFYPSDPAGNVPSGIDSFIKGILKFAPPDLDYLLLGATSDPAARPAGRMIELRGQERVGRFLPLVEMDADGTRRRVPLTVRYLAALRDALRSGAATASTSSTSTASSRCCCSAPTHAPRTC
jgi:hypothetical protein